MGTITNRYLCASVDGGHKRGTTAIPCRLFTPPSGRVHDLCSLTPNRSLYSRGKKKTQRRTGRGRDVVTIQAMLQGRVVGSKLRETPSQKERYL